MEETLGSCTKADEDEKEGEEGEGTSDGMKNEGGRGSVIDRGLIVLEVENGSQVVREIIAEMRFRTRTRCRRVSTDNTRECYCEYRSKCTRGESVLFR